VRGDTCRVMGGDDCNASVHTRLPYLNKWGWVPPVRSCLEWGTGIHRIERVEVRSQGVTVLYRYIPHK